MEKIEILKTRDYRGGIGLKNAGDIISVTKEVAEGLVEQGTAKYVSDTGTKAPVRSRVSSSNREDS